METTKGKAYRWVFDVGGKTVSDHSARESRPTLKNKTGRWLCALTGRPLTTGSVDPDEYAGRTYTLILDPKEGGGSKINTFKLLA